MACLSKHCPILVGSARVRFASARQGASECDIHRKLGSPEARQVLGENLNAPPIIGSDPDVHVPQKCVEPDSRTCFSADSGQNTFNGCCTFPQPACARTRCSVSPHWIQTTLAAAAPCLIDLERQLEPFQKHGPEQVRGNHVLWCRGSVSERCSSLVSGTEDVRDNWLDGLTVSGSS